MTREARVAYKSIKYELCNLKAEYLRRHIPSSYLSNCFPLGQDTVKQMRTYNCLSCPLAAKKKTLKGKSRNLESSDMYIFAFTTLLAINDFYIAGGACRGLSFANSLADTERRRETGNWWRTLGEGLSVVWRPFNLSPQRFPYQRKEKVYRITNDVTIGIRCLDKQFKLKLTATQTVTKLCPWWFMFFRWGRTWREEWARIETRKI